MAEWKVDRVKNINEETVMKILNTYNRFDGNKTSAVELGKCLYESGIYTKSMDGLSDEEIKKKWGAYIGIFTSNALGYTEYREGICMFNFTPLARQLRDKKITYDEYIIKIVSRTQFPKPGGNGEYAPDNVFDKPFIKILKCLYILYFYSEDQAWIDYYDVIEHLEKQESFKCNYIELCNNILRDRKNGKERNIEYKGRDIFMHKCAETDLILEKDNVFYLSKNKIDDAKKIVLENENEYFNGEKKEWQSYWGGEI